VAEVEPDEWRHVGWVEVESGCMIVGDPTYLLPWKERGKPGINYQVAIDADASNAVTPIARKLALLFQRFGGDGRFPVFARFDGEELVSIQIDFVDPTDD
jgi:hypothetical protein